MKNFKLSAYAVVLVIRMRITGLPGMTRQDRNETAKLCKDKNTNKRHLQVTKSLFANSKRATAIKKLASAARAEIKRISLPGEVDAKYLIPAAKFQSVSDKLDKLQSDYRKAIIDFANNLQFEIDQDRAAKHHAFDVADYPTARQIESSADFVWGFEPLPDSSGFNSIFSETAIAHDMAQAHDNHLKELFQRACEVNADRLTGEIQSSLDKLESYETKLAGPKGKRAPKLGYNVLVERLEREAKQAKELNLCNDLAVQTMANAVIKLVGSINDPSKLASDVLIRDDVKQQLKALLLPNVSHVAPTAPKPAIDDLKGIPTVKQIAVIESQTEQATETKSVESIDLDSLDF